MKSQILEILRNSNTYVSGQELCDKFGVSRTAVWKAINGLKEQGYEIEAVQNKGYRLVAAPDVLNQIELESIRKTDWAGCEVHYYDTIDSTNTEVQRLANAGAPHGTLVVANQQTAGKGRRGRTWISPTGVNVYFSLLLRPEINPNNASRLTLVAALALGNAIRELSGADVKIKWPNDIVINGKKICGILTEMSIQEDYISHIVVGMGINVHQKEFAEEIQDMASSIELETGESVSRAGLVERTMEYFEKFYEIYLQTEDLSALVKLYNSMLVSMHNDVRVLDPKEPFEGKAMGITAKGELIVDTWESRKLVSSGEVSVRGLYGYV